MRPSLKFTIDKRKMIEYETRRKAINGYGITFTSHEENTKNSYVSVWSKYGFNDFFIRNDAAELTKTYSAWDSIWTNEISSKKCGIEFKRPCTLGLGGDCCRFEFYFD